MDFIKMQGAANDFVLIEAEGLQRDWANMAIKMCDRHLGVGADSLLLLLPSDKADFRMLTYDADGSEAETCGNGIRCLARYVYDKGLVKAETREITIETAAGISLVRLQVEGGKIIDMRTNMGKPVFSADSIPVATRAGESSVVDIKNMLVYKTAVGGIDLELSLVSMGNPHAVHFCSQPVAEFPLSGIGPKVERLPIFPRRTNFEVVRVLDRQHLEARVWERGVGETLACGSGACAITVASSLLGYSDKKIDIELPGGTLNAEWNGEGEVILGGPAETVFEGKWPD